MSAARVLILGPKPWRSRYGTRLAWEAGLAFGRDPVERCGHHHLSPSAARSCGAAWARELERYRLGRSAADRAAAGEVGQGATRLGSHSQPCRLGFCRRPECRGFRDRQAELTG